MANRLTSAARIAATGKTPGDRRAALYAQRDRIEQARMDGERKRAEALRGIEELIEQSTDAQVEAMIADDDAVLEELAARRRKLVGDFQGSISELTFHFGDGRMDTGVRVPGGLLAEARNQVDVAKLALGRIADEIDRLHFEERDWFRREASARLEDYRKHVRLSKSALADAEDMHDELVDLCGKVVAGHRKAGRQAAEWWVGHLVGAEMELDRALESTGFSHLDD